jgi:hypothetical protein
MGKPQNYFLNFLFTIITARAGWLRTLAWREWAALKYHHCIGENRLKLKSNRW